MVVFGGRSDTQAPQISDYQYLLNDIHIFDTRDNTWTRVEANGFKPEKRNSHVAC